MPILPLIADAQLRTLAWLDWAIVIGFVLVSLAIGLYFSRRAQGSTEAYFKGGARMGWLLLGTSMVATAFAADTPLALSEWVVTKGLSQNWFWWSMVPVTMLGVFFFARLWKRANPLTDMELVYMRYSGTSADTLRVGKALWLAFPYGCMNLGWVNKAMLVIVSYVIPEVPRIPIFDSALLFLFLWTPLSSGVDSNLADAVRTGEVRPLEIGYEQGLLPHPRFWAAYEGGKFEAAEGAAATIRTGLRRGAVEELGLDAVVAIESRASIPGIPDTLALDSDGGGDALDVLHGVYQICAGVNQYKVLSLLFLIVIAYTAIAGLLGVMVTDFIQFWVAMVGCVALAYFAVDHVGGLEPMFLQIQELYGSERARGMLGLFPSADAAEYGLVTQAEFLLLALVFWWAFAFTDGGSFFAQRLLSAKDERNAALGYLWYGIAHYALRMWPWLLVGFAAAVLYPYVPFPNGNLPGAEVAQAGYVKVMLDVLPTGWLGLLVAALFAAYMSTISTWVNLGASYVMNDVYRPFVAPRIEARRQLATGQAGYRLNEKHYVRIGIIATLAVALGGIVVSLFLHTISGAWFILAGFNAGIGVIYLLRWYWWRINAWSELVCLVSLLVLSGATGNSYVGEAMNGVDTVLFSGTAMAVPLAKLFQFPYNLLVNVPLSVGIALLATFLTQPTRLETLKAFHRKVQAGGPGWSRIDRLVREDEPGFAAQSPLTWGNYANWLLSSAAVYYWLLGLGKVIIGDTLYAGTAISTENGILWGSIVALAVVVTIRRTRSLRPALNHGVFFVVLALVYVGLPVGEPIAESWLGFALGERVVGVALLIAGLGCGWLVARSFSVIRWR